MPVLTPVGGARPSGGRVQVRETRNDEATGCCASGDAALGPGLGPAGIAETCARPDRIGDVLHNFDADGFTSLKPEYAGG
jgi:hypothetical protein